MALTLDSLASLATETVQLIQTLRRSVVLVDAADGHGSGVIWSRDGLIVTNHHVVGRDRAEVELADGRRLAASVIARDRDNDLALLRVSANDLPAVTVGDSRRMRVGEIVLAVGNPFGVRGTATLGIISATGQGTWMGQTQRPLLQADVTLAPGNSGGPLADTQGRVMGIASMILSPGIALAIPSHIVEQFVIRACSRSYRRAA